MQATRQVTNIAWDIDDEELNFSEKLLVTDVGDLADLSFYELSENEWKQAVRKYQSLSFDGDVNYRDRTATASINIGTDAYFDNDTILGQFERLFQMREFKQEYKDNQVEIIVGNARTHTAKSYSLQDFGKNVDTRCPVEQIEYVDENGVAKVVDCYFRGGENKDKSKGLVELCKDLGVQLPAKIKLDEIGEILSRHRAFRNTNKGTSTFVQQTTRPRHRSSLSIPSITSVEGQPSTTNRVFGTSPLF
ncbi:unnamed protein product [Didymodactylos carnosus]|uniref:Uncharacterized protein n=1 Tax=Didymodactylos carnosus TaxID=1234261 RepID=A0A815Y856_9BILA|nr:unnamed protein product [Didymodactylos carnosus]CAF4429739.1 unnamed protein product [Didymodactylos carnosus]